MSVSPSDATFRHGADGEQAWFGLLYVQGLLIKTIDKALKAEHDLPLSWFEVILRLAAADDFMLSGL